MLRLAKEIKINQMTLKNRIVMPAIHHVFTPDGSANDKFKEYYYKRAEGGVAMIIVGGCRFDDYGAPDGMMSLRSDDLIPGWKEFTKGIQDRGSKIAVQLYHAGRYSRQSNLPAGELAYAPSAVYSKYTRETPKAMSIDEINQVIKDLGQGARRAKEAGFDAVELLGSAGYLISQFLSPITNLREDSYGGSFENRCRFALESIQEVRKVVGSDYPVIMRIAGNDFMKGGNTNKEAVEFAKVIESAGIDAINVTGGWHETKVPQMPGEVPRAGFAYLAKSIKDEVKVPVLSSNRYSHPMDGELVLALEMADIINYGRPLIADPELPNKLLSGRVNEIRQCVGCNQGCLAKTFFGQPIECTVNGFVGREHEITNEKTSTSKNILVVGAGVAGMESAKILKERGHEVTIWEKGSKVGGQLHLVSAPPGKEEFYCLVENLKNDMKRLEIDIVFNKLATKENIMSSKFETVILSVGATPRKIKLPNDQGEIPVVTAAEILNQEYIAGKNVVVIGGGSVGCETALYLSEEASLSKEQLMFLMVHDAETPQKIGELLNKSNRNVSIIEMQKRIGAGFDPGTGWPVFKQLKRLGVKQYTLSNITEIIEDRVVFEKDGEIMTEKADTIVLAVGSISNNELYDSLKEEIEELYTIGDANEIGKVMSAMKQAVDLAVKI